MNSVKYIDLFFFFSLSFELIQYPFEKVFRFRDQRGNNYKFCKDKQKQVDPFEIIIKKN